jgi:hypothetical protein
MKQLRERVAEAILEALPSFGVAINNPADITNAKYARAIADHASTLAIQTVLSDPRIVGLVEALEDIQSIAALYQNETYHGIAANALIDFNQMRSE